MRRLTWESSYKSKRLTEMSRIRNRRGTPEWIDEGARPPPFGYSMIESPWGAWGAEGRQSWVGRGAGLMERMRALAESHEQETS
jgi:hypothetical protein